MRPGLLKKPESFNDAMVEVDEFWFCKRVDINHPAILTKNPPIAARLRHHRSRVRSRLR